MEHMIERKCPLSKERMLFLFLHYFLGYNLLYPLFLGRLTKWIDPMARSIPQPLQLLLYLWMIISSVYVAWPLMRESVEGLKKNYKQIVPIIHALLVLYYITFIIINIIITQFSETATSANQSEIVRAIQDTPNLTFFSIAVYAPIVEEILFRGVFYRALRPHMKWQTASFISAITFGFIHVMYSLLTGNFADMIYLISYAWIGFFMAMAYEKTDTLFGSFLLHFLNNTIAYLMLVM